MQLIPENFTENGYKYTQIKRDGMLAIYKREKLHHFDFEVVKIHVQQAREAFGKSYPTKEMYPTASGWGQTGFTCVTINRANAKFDELIKKQQKYAKTTTN